MGENGLIKMAEKAADEQSNAEAKDNDFMEMLEQYISDKISKDGEEHGIYFNQPYNAVFDLNGDGEVELLTLVVYEDKNSELFINQMIAESYGQEEFEIISQDMVLSPNGTTISLEGIDFKLNTETHDLYFGEKYNVTYTDTETLVEYVLYEDGSCEIYEDGELSQTLPAGTCVYTEGKLTMGTNEAYVSMDGTQVISPGNVIISRNTIQFDKPYFGFTYNDTEDTITYIFHEDGSADKYRNGKFEEEIPAGAVVYENNYIYIKYGDELENWFEVMRGGRVITDLWGRGYTQYYESVKVQGTLNFNVVNDDKYINNGELTIPEYWIGDDGLKYITDKIYLTISNREDIKSIVIPNGAAVRCIDCQSVEEFKVNVDNENYIVEDGVLYNKDKTELVVYPGGKKDTTFKIPDGVKSLRWEYYVSGTNSYVTTLIVPSSLENTENIARIFPAATINYEGTE